MEESLNNLSSQLDSQLNKISNIKELNNLWLDYFGSKGKLKSLVKQLTQAPVEKKAQLGKLFNSAKKNIEKSFVEKRKYLENLKEQKIQDVTVPGIKPSIGHLHPQTQVLKELLDIFRYLGYQVADGPEIES